MNSGAAAFEWFLEGIDPAARQLWRIALTRFPCRIGRRSDLDIALPSPQVSLEHAEIRRGPDATLVLGDLGSTNGTFLNGERVVGEVAVAEGDIVHFAGLEFRLGRVSDPQELRWLQTTTPSSSPLAALPRRSRIEDYRRLRGLMDGHRVESLFQPIVRLPGGEPIGFEALGVGRDESLPASPTELYAIAEEAGLEAELTAVFRADALRAAHRFSPGSLLFLNVHAAELEPGRLLATFAAIRAAHPELGVVVEISERLAMPVERLRILRDGLAALGMGIAYDDFGAGLARLQEIIEVPPQFLKFDMQLVRGLDRAAEPRRQFVAALVEAARGLGLQTVAEGVERESEARCCAGIGFSHAQGYLFGRPAPLPGSAPP